MCSNMSGCGCVVGLILRGTGTSIISRNLLDKAVNGTPSTERLDRWSAYVFGRRKDKVFSQLQELLKPFGIKRYCTDGWGAYERHLPVELHEVGKQKTQTIERKHLNLRTRIKRLVRKTICFSKTELMHDLVIGLFINRYEFGLLI